MKSRRVKLFANFLASSLTQFAKLKLFENFRGCEHKGIDNPRNGEGSTDNRTDLCLMKLDMHINLHFFKYLNSFTEVRNT